LVVGHRRKLSQKALAIKHDTTPALATWSPQMARSSCGLRLFRAIVEGT
jgi:hypothetical protein